MALLQYRAPVDYEAQQKAFRDFLENFKSFEEETVAEELEDLQLNGDNTSDEYDFMDDAEEGRDRQRRRRQRDQEPKRKYMKMLQQVADRKQNSILVELDDLEKVRHWESMQRYIYLDRKLIVSDDSTNNRYPMTRIYGWSIRSRTTPSITST